MKYVLNIFLLIVPSCIFGQTLQNVLYDQLFERKYRYISYSEIQDHEIRKIIYSETVSLPDFDSLQHKKVMKPHIFYYTECFDSSGFLIGTYSGDSVIQCSQIATLRFRDHKSLFTSCYLNKPYCTSATDTFSKKVYYDEDENMLSIIPAHEVSVFFYFNDNDQLIKDSISADIRKQAGCGNVELTAEYIYNEEGRLIKKIYKEYGSTEIFMYDDKGRIDNINDELIFFYKENSFLPSYILQGDKKVEIYVE